MSDGTPLLIGRGLHKNFGPTPALRGVDLSVDAGEVIAVMDVAAPPSEWVLPSVGFFAGLGVGVLAAFAVSSLALLFTDIATRHDSVRFE